MKKILLVEDDQILGETIADILEDEGFAVTWVKDGKCALDKSFEDFYELYLFDVNVPFISGFELLCNLRQSGDNTPAIFITALVDNTHLAKGFEMGADDYIKKPFDAKELIIRINAQIQKSFKSRNNVISYKDLHYDISAKTLTKEKEIIHLSPSEYELLELFLQNISKVLSKDDIIYRLKNGELGSDATLRVQVSRLKKIGFVISNIRSIGYRLESV